MVNLEVLPLDEQKKIKAASLAGRTIFALKNAKKSVSNYVLPIFLAVSVGAGGALTSYKSERAREARIPLGFFEIHQIEKDNPGIFEVVEGAKPNKQRATVYYLAGLNDLTMKVFECWNTANERGDVAGEFPKELEARFDSDNKKHRYELRDLFEFVPGNCELLKEDATNFTSVHNMASKASTQLENAWDGRHNNVHHKETYIDIEIYSDGKGNLHTRPVPKTKLVYDYTIHNYDYNSKSGEAASKTIDELAKISLSISPLDKSLLASKTNPEGERAAIESRTRGEKTVELSSEELRTFANTWYTGATIIQIEPRIHSALSQVREDALKWKGSKANAKSSTYTNKDPYDKGPLEYQVVQGIIPHCKELEAASGEYLQSLQKTSDELLVLRQKIQELVDASHNGEYSEYHARDILRYTQQLYLTNFSNGFDINQFRTERPILFGFGGIILGAGAGIGLMALRRKFLPKFISTDL